MASLEMKITTKSVGLAVVEGFCRRWAEPPTAFDRLVVDRDTLTQEATLQIPSIVAVQAALECDWVKEVNVCRK